MREVEAPVRLPAHKHRPSRATGCSSWDCVLLPGKVPVSRSVHWPSFSANSGTVEVLPGDGTGMFASAVAYDTGPQPYNIALGDVDGDKILDAVTADFGGTTVSVLFGIGDCTFSDPSPETVASAPRSISIVDFDEDGSLDILAPSFDAQVVSLLVGQGDGTFGPFIALPVGQGPYVSTVADMDADGRLNLVSVARDAGTVSIVVPAEDGTFAETEIVVGLSPLALVVADFNEDGSPTDQTALSYTEGRLHLLRFLPAPSPSFGSIRGHCGAPSRTRRLWISLSHHVGVANKDQPQPRAGAVTPAAASIGAVAHPDDARRAYCDSGCVRVGSLAQVLGSAESAP